MAFRGYFIFESCSFGSATSKTEMYRNVNDSLYYKDRIEYEKTMIHFLLLWGKKPISNQPGGFLVITKLSSDHGKMPSLWVWNKTGIVSCLLWKIFSPLVQMGDFHLWCLQKKRKERKNKRCWSYLFSARLSKWEIMSDLKRWTLTQAPRQI